MFTNVNPSRRRDMNEVIEFGMTGNEAQEIIRMYRETQKNYFTYEVLCGLLMSGFKGFADIWDTLYIKAFIVLNAANGMNEKDNRATDENSWPVIAKFLRELLAERETTEGKKKMLRTRAPKEFRCKWTDEQEHFKSMSVKVSSSTGTQKEIKKQTQLNLERMEHIKALEKNISPGGDLRESYNEIREQHLMDIENLPTNEQAANFVMRDKRKKRIPALLLCWLIMPIYVILKSLDLLFDSMITEYHKYYDPKHSKFGGEHPFLGKMSFNIGLGFFIGAMVAMWKSVDPYIKNSEVAAYFVSGFTAGFLFMSLFRTVLGIVIDPITHFVGKHFAQKASEKLQTMSADEFQVGIVNYSYERAKHYLDLLEDRQLIIEDLRKAIETNAPYGEIDELRKEKDISIKNLAKLEAAGAAHRGQVW